MLISKKKKIHTITLLSTPSPRFGENHLQRVTYGFRNGIKPTFRIIGLRERLRRGRIYDLVVTERGKRDYIRIESIMNSAVGA